MKQGNFNNFFMLVLFASHSVLYFESWDNFGYYKNCEVVPPNAVVSSHINDQEFKFDAWYNISSDADSLNYLSSQKVYGHETFIKILNHYDIYSDQSSGVDNAEVVAIIIYVNDYSRGDIFIKDKNTAGLLVYYVSDDTLETRFYRTNENEPRLISDLNARPKYLTHNDIHKSLSVLENSKKNTVISIVNPSAANNARKGSVFDLSNKIQEYLQK